MTPSSPKNSAGRFARAGFASAMACASAAAFVTGVRADSDERGAGLPRTLPEVEWNTPVEHFQFDDEKYLGQRLSVLCPPRHVTDEDEPLYGTGVYPSESPICVAAVHSGAVTAEGGPVTLQLNPGLEAYAGSFVHGIESRDLPGTERSIVFIGYDPTGAADAIQAEFVERLDWDDKFTRTGLANIDLVGQRFAFDCPAAPADLRARRVVGTDSYAFDSMICRAAVHAGVINFDGGPVLVQMDPAVRDLPGSIRNGVETASAGSSGVRSISFVLPVTEWIEESEEIEAIDETEEVDELEDAEENSAAE